MWYIRNMARNLSEKQKVGNLGEDIACTFLMKHGYSIENRNYWKKWGEIDILACKESKLHFVEVKSVSRENFESVIHETNGYRPEENVHPRKLDRLRRVIQSYLIDKRVDGANWQFDVITVYIDRNQRKARVKVLDDVVL